MHEVHTVRGRAEDDFEAAFREGWMPRLAEGADARLLWYTNHAHGSGPAYTVVTVTAVRDGAAWERLAVRIQKGDLRRWMRDLDELRHDVEAKLLVPLSWSPLKDIDLDAVPAREEGMTPYEFMLSESQERMLMTLKPGREAEAKRIFEKWGLDAVTIGVVTGDGLLRVRDHGRIVAEIPNRELADEAPLYDRPYLSREEYQAWAQVKPLGEVPESTDLAADLLRLMASPDIASRRWIWEQYDQKVGGDTVQPPGGDAAVVRVHGSDKALAWELILNVTTQSDRRNAAVLYCREAVICQHQRDQIKEYLPYDGMRIVLPVLTRARLIDCLIQ